MIEPWIAMHSKLLRASLFFSSSFVSKMAADHHLDDDMMMTKVGEKMKKRVVKRVVRLYVRLMTELMFLIRNFRQARLLVYLTG